MTNKGKRKHTNAKNGKQRQTNTHKKQTKARKDKQGRLNPKAS